MKSLIESFGWVAMAVILYGAGFWSGRDWQKAHTASPVTTSIVQTSGGENSGNVVVLDGGEVVISGEGNEASVVVNGKAAKK